MIIFYRNNQPFSMQCVYQRSYLQIFCLNRYNYFHLIRLPWPTRRKENLKCLLKHKLFRILLLLLSCFRLSSLAVHTYGLLKRSFLSTLIFYNLHILKLCKKEVYTPESMCYTNQGEFSPCSGTGHSDHLLICGGQSIIIIEYRRKSQ